MLWLQFNNRSIKSTPAECLARVTLYLKDVSLNIDCDEALFIRTRKFSEGSENWTTTKDATEVWTHWKFNLNQLLSIMNSIYNIRP